MQKQAKIPENLKNLNAKAQGLSLNTIVIAALVLIVLVVVIAIFSGAMGDAAEWFSSCSSKNGQCLSEDQCENRFVVPGRGCGDNEVCCSGLKPENQ